MRLYGKEKQSFYAWLDLPPYERNPQTKVGFAKIYGVSRPTLNKWEKERGEFDIKEFFLSKSRERAEGMQRAVERGNAQMAKFVAQLAGEYVEKSEITHTILTADDYDRIRKQAEDEARGGVLRIRTVSSKPTLLSE